MSKNNTLISSNKFNLTNHIKLKLPETKQLLTNRRRSGVSAAACNKLVGSTSEFVAVADTTYLSLIG
jgi:hypothetical protein